VITWVAADGSSRQLSYGQLQAAVLELADRLREGGLSRGHVIGIQAENSLDWVVWDIAAAHLGAALRPYPAHHEFAAEARIGEHGLALLVSDRAAHQGRPHVAPVQPEAFVPGMVAAAAPPSDQPDLHSIVYSSGTTGREKVLQISRKGAEAALNWLGRAFHLGPEDRHVVFLPLTGLQQRQQIYGCINRGVNVTLCAYQRAMPTIRAVKPTFLVAPPALYENMLSIAESIGQPLSDLFGGESRVLITGMAPIRRAVMDAYWQAGLELMEGYGLTECGIIACNTPGHCKPGTVGRPVDPQAFSLSPEGEVLVKQPHPLSLGYLGAEDLNSATYAADGTVMTGDIGHLDEDGFLILDGRIKDMIVLPSGKKLHPGDLEQILLQLGGVEDAVAVDNGAGVTAVLNVRGDASAEAIRAGLRQAGGTIDAAGAINQIIFADMPLTQNPEFQTANMKLNRRLVGARFLGGQGDAA
jgi:long-subunit acyl-CoA synthetase (AMP-forming)